MTGEYYWVVGCVVGLSQSEDGVRRCRALQGSVAGLGGPVREAGASYRAIGINEESPVSSQVGSNFSKRGQESGRSYCRVDVWAL